ncbi:MAG: DNA repair exonuclease [Sulfobacillus thermosulfidooxidans]|uniref:DNA repair exonuclease n=1 Tax=Sulfobacillus thermotolerans TaxID=338644 RepID=A0ABM6RR75_9FIRM|nr:DNA repair exonuclease [Sulfobacillus thermotolerans]PSR36957.1 MAG: DNA repair exonuclease [Sulfobacillus thermosulfidooxidans]
MYKFIHCSDLHLDSPLRGLTMREDAPTDAIRSATRRALENLVSLSIAEAVRFVVIAGDIFDGDWIDYSTGLFFNACMAQLTAQNIAVYILNGNHDAASQMSRKLVPPDGVYRFSHDRPETFVIEELQVALHGQGFKNRAVTENLVPEYPTPVRGYFNIGVLHTSLEGHEGHEAYAPCTVQDLVMKGYDYWALGHVHKRQVIRSENPTIVYPGNIQGRHIRETGDKGCTVVTVDGSHVSLEHRPLDVLRWSLCTVNLENAAQPQDVVDRCLTTFQQELANHPGYPLAVRIRLTGTTSLHGALLAEWDYYYHEILNAAQQSGVDRIWVEKVLIDTQPMAVEQVSTAYLDAWSELDRLLQAVQIGDPFLDEFLKDMKAIQRRMPDYNKDTNASEVRPMDLLSQARDLLEALIAKGGAL